MLSFGGKPDRTNLSVISAPSLSALLALASAYELDVSYNAGSGFTFFERTPVPVTVPGPAPERTP